MTYKIRTNLKRFHEYFTTNLDKTKHIKKNHALLFECGLNGYGNYEEIIVARLWRQSPRNWKVEIWHEGNCVLGSGKSKAKAVQLAKFVLAGAKIGEPIKTPKFVWC